MSRYNTTPVPPEKIKLIHDLLQDPEVNEAWILYTNLAQAKNTSDRALVKARFQAWHNYVLLRDKFLGLPTYNKYFLDRAIYAK